MNNNLRAKQLGSGGGILTTEYHLPSYMSNSYVYFEINVISQGNGGRLYIGLTSENPVLSVDNQNIVPSGNYWYSNEGTIYKTSWVTWGPSFGSNDVIGCGVEKQNHNSSDGPKYRLFYTFNGRNLGSSVDIEGDDLDENVLGPSLCFSGEGWEVEANFGGHPFLFDLRCHDQNVAFSKFHKHKNVKCVNRYLCAQVKNVSKRGGIVQAEENLKPTQSKPAYFEIKILRQDILAPVPLHDSSTGGILIGLKISDFTEELSDDHNNRLQNQIETNRYWYSASGDKSREFKKEPHGVCRTVSGEEPYGVRFGHGDVVGCGLTYEKKVFFTVNGESQGLAFSVSPEDFTEGLRPAIELHSPWSVEANFGKEKFLFDPITNCRNELF